MSAVNLKVKGGARMALVLAAMAAASSSATGVRVGFLEGATYPETDGSRLTKAADTLTDAQKTEHPSWEARLRAWAAWADKHHPTKKIAQVAFWNEFGTTRVKPRPFFRSMIAANEGDWGSELAGYLRETEYDSDKSLRRMGVSIQEELRDSILQWPGDNKPLTVHIKGFNKALTDNADMRRAVDYEVTG